LSSLFGRLFPRLRGVFASNHTPVLSMKNPPSSLYFLMFSLERLAGGGSGLPAGTLV
jgi:hypothetical protein